MYDTLIIGAGPAGLTALLYATHYGLKVACIGDVVGGKFLLAPDAIDYPGIPNTTGKDFIEKLQIQLSEIKAELIQDFATSIVSTTNHFTVTTTKGNTFESQTIIIATGNGKKQRENNTVQLASQLNVPLENGSIKVDTNGMTSQPGIFAAGDCCLYPEALEQLATATASGIRAAAGAYEYLKKSKPPILWGTAKIPRA